MSKAQSIVSAVVVLLVFVLNQLGWAVGEDEAYQAVSAAAALACLCWGVWKNHNFTEAANEAQQVLELLKDGEVSDNHDGRDGEDAE